MAAPTNPVQYGVTPPLSSAPPSDRDLKLNETLTSELKAQKNFPSDDDKTKKEQILAGLKTLLRRMVQEVGKKRGLPQSILDVAGGEVYTYGSHRLGVSQGSSDVDTLMVAPKHCTREDFFEIMPGMLKTTTDLGEVSEPNAVPGINVPIIKVEIRGVDIDLIFCALQVSSVPDGLSLNDMNLLRGISDTDMRCINGTRVTNRIIELVPHRSTFRLALRAVKLWSTRRALYGNIIGFPGGVAYAIMVARVCQLYPMAAAPVIVQKFFFVMKRWNWPSPVRLQSHEPSPLQYREWDPKISRGDATHLMPVLTPSYPVANTTHTITVSTKKVMLQELDRGYQIVQEIFDGKSEWKDLFQRHTFFTSSYRHFICVHTGSKSNTKQEAWEGFVMSKLKILAAGIEHSDGGCVELVQCYNKGFNRVHGCRTQTEIDAAFDGDVKYQIIETKETEQTKTIEAAAKIEAEAEAEGDGATGTKDELSTETKNGDGSTPPTTNGDAAKAKDEVQKVFTTTYYLGIGLVKGANSLDLSNPIANFKQLCVDWDKYDDAVNAIRIKYMKAVDLPADVFVAGEIRPTRGKKTKAAKKRTVANAGLEEQSEAKRHQKTNGTSATPTPTTNGTAAAPAG